MPFGIGLSVAPRGSDGALGAKVQLGHVGLFFMPNRSAPQEYDYHARIAALNQDGLSCDEQHLNGSQFMTPSGDPTRDLSIHRFCEWAAGNFASVAEVKTGLSTVRIIADPVSGGKDHHYVVRDGTGAALLVEATDGRLRLFDDFNDGGQSGFGVVTNSPRFDVQMTAARRCVNTTMPAPGGWHSQDRFQRLAMVKSALPQPKDLQSAVAQTFAVMSTVSAPEGRQRGQDWIGEFTVAGFVRDHRAPTLYWRSARNPQIQRLRLADLDLKEGAKRTYLSIAEPSLLWFHDATSTLLPVHPSARQHVR
eukprot:CAMPEP_0119321548 /NCGR_PEP_ID=MMETSP1333-20130426/55698_1 /TAXON_ID=418940 /ORGANISM="Scyphosphaera apsteinii, Strain RCC1455" /LENGTH=306 /DNA_ID=CAMNT_0007328549 /DNA_START=249 /DNA_END=1169 /DNA_ORIENTATION=-